MFAPGLLELHYSQLFSVKVLSPLNNYPLDLKCNHIKWVPHHGMAHLQVADGGGGLQIWRVAINMLNMQSADSQERVVLQPGGWIWASSPLP
jgi:hypothetical protein